MRHHPRAIVFTDEENAREDQRRARHRPPEGTTERRAGGQFAATWSISNRVKRETIQRLATPTAILVSLPEPLATNCDELLVVGGLKVAKVGDVAAACERIPVVMPQLVMAPSTLKAKDMELLEDSCVAVGAELMKVDTRAAFTSLIPLVKEAANTALIRALRRGA